jgi:ribosomal protein S18 acetylase RimI-like enzyme
MPIAIRQMTADDWSLVRNVRLRALADAPTAFAARLEDERDRPESAWRERLSSVTSGTFLAVDEDVAVGIVAVFLTPDDGSRAHLVSMWVSPERRKARIARALIDAVLRWSRDHGAQSVELWVTVTNEAARRLYLRSGFRETGVRQALPSDPSIEEVEMRLVHRGA